jgi:deoxyribose-phosphate aldolase
MTVTTVVNFPKPHLDQAALQKQIKQALELGADEIDIVFPYESFDPENPAPILAYLKSAKAACPNNILKVIIESGEAPSVEWIEQASHCVIESGANFIKTSTGKTTNGASLEAARMMAYALHEADDPCGLKISGGVKTIEQANDYIDTVTSILGNSFIAPEWFRFGASSLLKECIEHLEK